MPHRRQTADHTRAHWTFRSKKCASDKNRPSITHKKSTIYFFHDEALTQSTTHEKQNIFDRSIRNRSWRRRRRGAIAVTPRMAVPGGDERGSRHNFPRKVSICATHLECGSCLPVGVILPPLCLVEPITGFAHIIPNQSQFCLPVSTRVRTASSFMICWSRRRPRSHAGSLTACRSA